MSFTENLLMLSKEAPQLDLEILKKLGKLFESLPPKYHFTADELTAELKIPVFQSTDLIENLIKSQLIESHVICPVCGEKLKPDSKRCGKCLHELCGETLYVVNSNPDRDRDIHKKIGEAIYEQDAKIIRNFWEENGYITYLAMDLAGSKAKQKLSDQQYRDFIGICFTEIWPQTLDEEKIDRLFLGDVGDLIKIAFTTPEKAIQGVVSFLKLFYSHHYNIAKRFDIFRDEPSGNIRFCAIATKLTVDGENIPAKAIRRNLLGRYDINSTEVTNLFRLSGYASPKNLDPSDSMWKASLLLNETLIKDISDQSLLDIAFEAKTIGYKKHDNEPEAKDDYFGFLIMDDFSLKQFAI